MDTINILKLDLSGRETWRYPAKVLARDGSSVTIEAYFNRDDLPFHGILLGRNDRFVETYYTNRFYNIFEIHSREDDCIRGWYCNISRPAVITPELIAYTDLALDLLVYPGGKQLVLDEDEFAELPLTDGEREKALSAMKELQDGFLTHRYPPIVKHIQE